MEAEIIEHLRKSALNTCGSGALDNPSITYYQPTGSLLLDYEIKNWVRRGGYPGGKVISIYGKRSAGKTGVALLCAKEVQRAGGLVIYANTPEQGYNPEYGDLIGVSQSEGGGTWIDFNPFSLESCLQYMEDTVEKLYPRDEPICIIIDPLSSLKPQAYTMGPHGKGTKQGQRHPVIKSQPQAAEAKMLHDFFRRGILWYARGTKITIIIIRHQTTSPEMFSSGHHTTHGSAVDFYSWLDLYVKRKDMDDPDGGQRAGSWIDVKIMKNKCGPLYGEVSLPMFYDRGFDEGFSLIQFLLDEKVLVKGHSGKIEIGGAKYYTRELMQMYKENHEWKAYIKQLVGQSKGLQAL